MKTFSEIRRVTRRRFSAEENFRIVLEGLRCADSIGLRCRLVAPEITAATVQPRRVTRSMH